MYGHISMYAHHLRIACLFDRRVRGSCSMRSSAVLSSSVISTPVHFMRCGHGTHMGGAPAYDALNRSFHYSVPRLQRLRQCPDLHPAVGPPPPHDSISSRYQRQWSASLHPRHCQLACPLPPCPPFQQHAHTRSSSNPDLLTHTAAVPPMS